MTRIVNWLLRGSGLELLVAVPSHVWARRPDDCSAPAVTGYGIATGLAIMLLSFGPGVFFLSEAARAARTEFRMTARTATTACLFLGLASFVAGRSGPEQPLPRIASPEALAIEMAKALVAADRARFTALAATRERWKCCWKRPNHPRARRIARS